MSSAAMIIVVQCGVPCNASGSAPCARSLVCACTETRCDSKTGTVYKLLGPLILADFQGRRNDPVSSPLWPKSGSWRLKSSSMPVFTEPADPVIVLRVSVDPGAVLCCSALRCAVLSCAVLSGAVLCSGALCCAVLSGAVLSGAVLCSGALGCAVLSGAALRCAVLSDVVWCSGVL